ncbi:MAG TPA: PA2169 family four-helix-bundle protein [Arenibaculum sp.]|nr:PA2169 family four-helix-bundle protein [Arenibaculum sp.]
MTRESEIDRNSTDRARSPSEIEQEIDETRARMDRTLDELEFKLSPGQIASMAIHELTTSNPGRLGEAIRRNPIPAILIGVGVLWLGLAMARQRPGTIEGHPAPAGVPPDELSRRLSPLIALTRQGADALRQAEPVVEDERLRSLATDFAEQHDRAAAALEAELRNRGGAPEAGVAPPSHPHPAWSELRRALTTRDRNAIISGMESGADATLAEFRRTLHDDLPEETRVLTGAHFHAMEQMHNRISALKHAVVD